MERFSGQGASGIHLINNVLGLTNKIGIKNGTENSNCCICRLGTAESSCKKNCVKKDYGWGWGVHRWCQKGWLSTQDSRTPGSGTHRELISIKKEQTNRSKVY